MPGTVSWYITFGIGTIWAGQYTEVRVTADLPTAEQGERARQAAFDRYGRAWAFHYPQRSYERSIASHGLTLREVVTA